MATSSRDTDTKANYAVDSEPLLSVRYAANLIEVVHDVQSESTNAPAALAGAAARFLVDEVHLRRRYSGICRQGEVISIRSTTHYEVNHCKMMLSNTIQARSDSKECLDLEMKSPFVKKRIGSVWLTAPYPAQVGRGKERDPFLFSFRFAMLGKVRTRR